MQHAQYKLRLFSPSHVQYCTFHPANGHTVRVQYQSFATTARGQHQLLHTVAHAFPDVFSTSCCESIFACSHGVYSSCLCATMIATARLDVLALSSAPASEPDGTCRTAPASIQSCLETNQSRLKQIFDKLEEEYKANDPLGKTICHPLEKALRVQASTSLRHCMAVGQVDQVDLSEPLAHSRRSSTTLVASESDDEATRTGALSAFDGAGSLAQYGADSIEGEGRSPGHSTFTFSSSDLAELGVRWTGRGGRSLDEP